MKSSDFANRLEEAAALLEAAQASASARHLRALAEIFKVLPGKTVADIVKKLDAEPMTPGTFLQTKVNTVTEFFAPLEALVEAVASKAVANDFATVHSLLRKHKDVSLDQFLATSRNALSQTPASKAKSTKPPKATRTDLVDLYNKRLEEALGDDDGFRYVYAQLESDPAMAAPELSALAKRFALASPKNREQSLRKIFARHQSLMIARAASRATAGRIAG